MAVHVTDGVLAPTEPALGSAELEERLDQLTHSRARPGNAVRMLFDGVQSFAERRRLIEGATQSIHLQTFIFNDDETGWDHAKLLVEKAKQGVAVRVIYDAVGSSRAEANLFEFLREHRVELRAWGDPIEHPLEFNDRWHEKHLIVDGRVSIEGGMNIANEYALGGSGKLVFSRGDVGTEPWRDADVRIEGPAVADAQTAFLRNWTRLGPEVPPDQVPALFPEPGAPGTASVRVVQHRPDQARDRNTHALYVQCIRSARQRIRIENAYFLPPTELREALCDAARRGVDVQVMTNSRESNDLAVVTDAARYFYDELIAAGVRLFEKQGGTLHAKTATFDGVYSIVGSANLNGRSESLDSEDAIAIVDGPTASAIEQRFADGLPQTREVTAEELENEDFLTNLRQFSLSLLAWTF